MGRGPSVEVASMELLPRPTAQDTVSRPKSAQTERITHLELWDLESTNNDVRSQRFLDRLQHGVRLSIPQRR